MHIPKPGKAGGNPPARHTHGQGPGGDGGGEDRPRTHIRGGLLAPELWVSGPSDPPTKPSKLFVRQPTRVRCGCSTPTSRACFDEIDRDALVAQFERRVADREMVKLLRSWLRVGIFEGGVVHRQWCRAPRKAHPSHPCLANIALHVLDQAWVAQGRRLGTLVRYCDDFVVLCPTQGTSRERLGILAAVTLAPTRVTTAPRQDQGRRTSGRDKKGSTSWASTITWWSPGNSRSPLTISRSGPRPEPWPPSGPRCGSRTHGVSSGRRPGGGCQRTQPRAAGMGGVLPLRKLGEEVRPDRPQLRRQEARDAGPAERAFPGRPLSFCPGGARV